MTTAYLSLGSNLGDRAANLRQALEYLASAGVAGPAAVLHLRDRAARVARAALVPQSWLSKLRPLFRRPNCWHAFGRSSASSAGKESIAKGPRTIDIDILFYGDAIVDTPELQIPHPRLADRRFVLEPLAELAPDLRHPKTGRTVSEMLAAIEGQTVKRR